LSQAQPIAVGSENSDRIFSGKSVRLEEQLDSDRLAADHSSEGKDDTDANAVKTYTVRDWNPTFAAVATELGIGIELCWPHHPQQKGAVENLVGWVKGSFFKQRRFDGVDYSMPAEAVSVSGTLYLYRDRVRIIAGRREATHLRLNESGQSSFLPVHRASAIAAVSGTRARRYLKRQHLLGSVLSPDFVTDGSTVACRHIQSGFDVLLTTAAKRIGELSTAAREGRFWETLLRYTHPAVLVVGELGYLAYGDNAANMLFHVANDRYLSRRSMIFTTNKKLTQWGRVLHDEVWSKLCLWKLHDGCLNPDHFPLSLTMRG
jgi:hypothetical protein